MKRILAISLLFIFIAGQVNLTWATHFCGSFAVQSSISMGIDDLSCGMEEESCCSEEVSDGNGPIITSEMCCSNDYYSSEADDFFLKVETDINQSVQFYAAYTLSFFELSYAQEYNYNLTHDIPNLIPPDRQVLHQNFLL